MAIMLHYVARNVSSQFSIDNMIVHLVRDVHLNATLFWRYYNSQIVLIKFLHESA